MKAAPRASCELCSMLEERLLALRPLVVADVLRVFLEVVRQGRLHSLEFAFDEHDGRIAKLEAVFSKRGSLGIGDGGGIEVQLLLPKTIPARPPEDVAALVDDGASTTELGARFLRVLADLGAYRVIERLELQSVTVLEL